jgi:hypothetical protein
MKLEWRLLEKRVFTLTRQTEPTFNNSPGSAFARNERKRALSTNSPRATYENNTYLDNHGETCVRRALNLLLNWALMMLSVSLLS